MPAFAGFNILPGEFSKTSPLSPDRPRNVDMWGDAVPGADLDFGLGEINQPSYRYGLLSFDGANYPSYYDDFYNRIWLIPQTVDFGAVSATVSRSVVMWNARRTSASLVEIDSSGDESVVVGGLTLPASLKPLAQRTLTVAASESGDAEIDFSIIFEFFSGEQVPLPVTGIRSKVWAFVPNWSSQVEVQYEFMTEVIESRSGFEQRIANLTEPRLNIRFSAVVNEGNFRQFIRQMASWQNKGTLMPDFSHGEPLSEVAESDQDILTFESVADWMVPGRSVVMTRGGASRADFMVRKIEEVIGNSIKLTADLDREWAAGSKVYPAYLGHLGAKITATQPTNRTAIVNVSFDADPGEELWWSVPAGSLFHLGRELFLERPDWSASITPEFESALEIVDYGKGRKDFNIPRPFNTRIHKAEYIEATRERTDAIVDFFRRNRGAQGEFFMPTFTEDLVLKTTAPAGTSSLRMAGREVYQDYVEDVVYRDLIIFYANGLYETLHVGDITAISDENGNDSVIGLTTPLTYTASVDTIQQICWLPLWRFATDGLTVQWVTDEISQISMSMRALRYVPAET